MRAEGDGVGARAVDPVGGAMSAARVLILLQNEPVPHDRHVWNEARALVGAGYDVTVICPAGEDRDREPYDRARGREDPPLPAPPGGRAGERIRGRVRRRAAPRCAGWRAGSSRERPFDLVHACSPPDFLLLAALRLRLQGARFVFDHHDLTPELYATRFGEGLLQRATLRRRAGRLPRRRRRSSRVNDSYRRVAIERGHRDPADVAVVRTGPDLSRFVPVRPIRS